MMSPRQHSWSMVASLAGALMFGAAFLEPAERGQVQAQAQRRLPPGTFDGVVDWINADKQLSLDDLKGRIVLLDFWTLC